MKIREAESSEPESIAVAQFNERSRFKVTISTFATRKILAGTRIHAYNLAFADEQRHTHDGTGFEFRGFGTTRCCVTTHTRIGFHNLQFNMCRRCHRQWLAVPQHHGDFHAIFDPLSAVAHGFFARSMLFEIIWNHEGPEFTIVVQILHLGFDHIGAFHGITGLEGAFNGTAGLQVAYFDTIERLALAGFHHFIFDDGVRIVLKHDLESGFEFIGAVAGHVGTVSISSNFAGVLVKRCAMIAVTYKADQRHSEKSAPSELPRWQTALADAVTDPAELLQLLDIPDSSLAAAQEAARQFPLKVPRGFVARMQRGNPRDPLLMQVLPLDLELETTPSFVTDPVGDMASKVAAGVLHKYEGRVLLIATGACGVHCRYCFRRHFPYADESASFGQWQNAVEIIRADRSIHEVILSGGDPLTLSDRRLRQLTDALQSIAHVKRLRIHSRQPIVLPERVDAGLLDWLRSISLQKVLVLHANHAQEIDASVSTACAQLREAGVTLLNQAVLLKGINDSVSALSALGEALFAAGVLPYYLHMMDRVQGAAHFEVDEPRARQLMRELLTTLPGYLVPRLVRETPGDASKTPVALW